MGDERKLSRARYAWVLAFMAGFAEKLFDRLDVAFYKSICPHVGKWAW
jgi:hypothetical protein